LLGSMVSTVQYLPLCRRGILNFGICGCLYIRSLVGCVIVQGIIPSPRPCVLCSRRKALLRHRVIPTGAERLTPKNTVDRQSSSHKKASFLICLYGIGRA
jgi:hypothetical protein